MNLSDFFRWCESKVPEADETVLPSISTTQLCKRDILNEGAKELVRISKCLPKETKFTCTANNFTYTLTSLVPNYMDMREEGIFHFRSDTNTTSTTTSWDRLKPTTMRELDKSNPTWRDQSPNDYTQKYWVDGDTLGVWYTPSTTITNGFWIYYYATSSDMSTATTYPFTGTTARDTRLASYEKHLLTYYESQALDILGYKTDAKAKLEQFYLECEKARMELDSRNDLIQEAQGRVKTYIGRGNPFR